MKAKVSAHATGRLFADTHAPAPPAGVFTANIDGAARGNPGPSSYAVIVRDAAGKIVLELAKKCGRQTNNVAEYYALLAALDYATSHHVGALRIRSDSELLVRQMQGRYKVKSADLKPLHERASKLSRQLQYFVIEHVRREQNRDADALANLALDSGDLGPGEREAPARAHATHSHAARPHVRARFEKGVFAPLEPIALPDGAEVILELHNTPKNE